MEVVVNNYSIAVIESLFKVMKGHDFDDVAEASSYMYHYVRKEGIYPEAVVVGYYSAMIIVSTLTDEQFEKIRSVFI